MIDKKTCELFLEKNIQIERQLGGRPVFSKGILKVVNDIILVIEFKHMLQTYDLKTIDSIREVSE